MASKAERLLEAQSQKAKHDAPFWECESCRAKIRSIEEEGGE